MNVFISAGKGCGRHEPADDPSAEYSSPDSSGGGSFGVIDAAPSPTQSVDRAAVPLEEHVDYSRHQRPISVGRTSVQSSNNVDRSDSGTK